MKKKIYIVEDNPIVSQLLSYSLENEFDCEIAVINQMDRFKTEILSFQPDIIVLDYHLKFDGVKVKAEDLLYTVKENLPDCQVIVFSGQKDKDVAIKMLKLGAANYVSKEPESFHADIFDAVREIFEIKEVDEIIRQNSDKARKTIQWTIIILLMIIFIGTLVLMSA